MPELLELSNLADRTVPDLLDRSGKRFGRDRPFYYDLATDRELNFGEFQDRVAGTADWLAARYRKGDVVGVALPNRLEYVILRYALSVAGLVEAAFNGKHKGTILKRMIDIAAPKVLFADSETINNIRSCGHDLMGVSIFDASDLGAITSGSIPWERRPDVDIAPGDASRIIFTSGTSGGSKGAEISHAYEVFSGHGYSRWVGLDARDRWLFVTPFFHIDAVCVLSTALHHGGGFALAPRFSASRFWQQATRSRATTFLYVGTILAILLKGKGPTGNTTLRCAIGGGCPGDLWERFEGRFSLPVIELFGMTECIAATINHHRNRRVGSVGQVLEGYQIAVVDRFDRPLPPGEKGEIVVRGIEPFALMNGYRGDPQATQNAMRNFWFHTGDRGSFDADGFMYYHGRMKDVIRVRGENVDASELESVVDALPGILYCAAISISSDISEDDIFLFIQPEPDAQIEPAAVYAALGEEVAPFMLPRYIRITESLPLTSTEKVLKADLVPVIDAHTWVRSE